MNAYQNSEQHLANLHKGSLIRAAQQKEQKKKRIEVYNLNPKRCLKCSNGIEYHKQRVSNFCSRSCSASYVQLGKKQSAETSAKKSRALKGRVSKFRGLSVGSYVNPRTKSCRIHYRTCNGCNHTFVVASSKGNYERKTCSANCHIEASVRIRKYPNGRRKLTWFDNPWQGKVLLESSWEVEIASLLTEKNIRWVRPSSVPWIDGSKTRYYFPDFYLPEQNMYLDPKNPWGMKRDKIKMQAIEKLIPILYGDKSVVTEYIEKL